jgi:D-alanyl-D-alanine carboxypeptidase/D-alanyl-D-alanine-endopeptidase (penicillin-binding protein 4)
MFEKVKMFLLALTISLSAQNKIADIVEKFSRSDVLKQAEWSVCVRYVDNGESLVSFNSRKNLAPASGLKVFTTSAALEILGPDYRYVTEVFARGEIKSGTLYGDLILRGSGDPTLGSSKVKGSLSLDSLMQKWTNAVRKAGIRKINGSVIADAGLFDSLAVPGQWYWIDLGNYYAAQTSALTINDNLYYLLFEPGKTVGSKAKFLGTEPTLSGLTFINEMKTDAPGTGDNGYVYRSPYDSLVYLRGTIPQGKPVFSIKGSLPDPPMFLATYLTNFLRKEGIEIKGKPKKIRTSGKYDTARLINITFSPPLKAIVRNINKISNNLYTEQLLKTIGLERFGYASEKNGIRAIFDFLNKSGVDTTGLNLYDGCGLSRSNTITAEMMVDLLIANTKRPWFTDFYNSLAVAGDPTDEGFFANFGKGTPLAYNGRIKSGYIGGVRSHSGYLKTAAGRLLAFSLIANNFTCDVKEINKIHESILIELSRLK